MIPKSGDAVAKHVNAPNDIAVSVSSSKFRCGEEKKVGRSTLLSSFARPKTKTMHSFTIHFLYRAGREDFFFLSNGHTHGAVRCGLSRPGAIDFDVDDPPFRPAPEGDFISIPFHTSNGAAPFSMHIIIVFI